MLYLGASFWRWRPPGLSPCKTMGRCGNVSAGDGGPAMGREPGDLLQGTLGLMILKALAAEERHGYGIVRWIQDVTGDVVQIEEGSLYPALRRLEDRAFVESRWGLSENNRRARFYAITRSGRKQLAAEQESWSRTVAMVNRLLESRS